jgi:predicted RND superfamily exporter protein
VAVFPEVIRTDISTRFQDMFKVLGFAKSTGIVVAMLVAVSLLPTFFIHWKGKSLRK